MTKEVIELTGELRGVRGDLAKVMKRLDWMDEDRKSERKKSKKHRLGSAAVFGLLILTIILGAREFNESRQRDQASCLAQNQTRTEIRESIAASLLVVAENTDNNDMIEPLIADVSDRLDETIPNRIC